MENEHGSDRQSPKAEEKKEEKKPPQVEPKGGTSDPADPPPED